jgi:hypothetical protein
VSEFEKNFGTYGFDKKNYLLLARSLDIHLAKRIKSGRI